MEKYTEKELKAMGLYLSPLELAIGKFVPSQATLTVSQIGMFLLFAVAIVNCPFGSIWSILAMCVTVFFFVGNCLLIVDYKGASSVDSILRCHLISLLCLLIGYLV